ncbi:MAG TPA: zf-HC2 domain-containing protein [Pyrinomonadaceae bacterium]|nr:zf-HC2 domain-containing protein [Pyrinomonadaceae bacterium]
MEVDFDKEIDTLLRKAHGDGPVLVGDFASSGHLDADAISAFAENAMPENSRALYSAHLAECTRCRKILSNLLTMNAEQAPAAAPAFSAITIAERSTPWYRKLLLFPNLAYVMGGLVLIFSGFLGYTIIQRSGLDNGASVSQISEPDPARGGPNAEVQQELSATSSANAAANIATSNSAVFSANTNAAMTAARTPDSGAGPKVGDNNNFVLDGTDTSSADVVSAPPPAPPVVLAKPEEKDAARGRDDVEKERTEDKVAGAPVQESSKNDLMLKQAPGSISQSQVQSGPMNRNERQYNRQMENLDARRAAALKKSAPRDEDGSAGRKVIAGKTFERKQGVWYDTTYQSQLTINVRRGTDEFNKLDSGLRSIANSLSGVAVIVWGAKAYRIQ